MCQYENILRGFQYDLILLLLYQQKGRVDILPFLKNLPPEPTLSHQLPQSMMHRQYKLLLLPGNHQLLDTDHTAPEAMCDVMRRPGLD